MKQAVLSSKVRGITAHLDSLFNFEGPEKREEVKGKSEEVRTYSLLPITYYLRYAGV